MFPFERIDPQRSARPARSGAAALWRWCALGIAGAVIALWMTGASAVASDRPAPSVEELKAAFLLNFPKYVEWPEGAFPEEGTPIRVVLLGDEKLEKTLRELTDGRQIAGRRVEIMAVNPEADATVDCHILFIPESERRRSRALLQRFGGVGVLTVGEAEDFLDHKGIIRLARRDRRIRLEVDLEAARGAGLKISSKLLGVADVVKGREN